MFSEKEINMTVIIGSVVLYLLSLISPALYLDDFDSKIYGWYLLEVGGVAWLYSLNAFIAWTGNSVEFLAFLLFCAKKYKWSLFWSIASIFISIYFTNEWLLSEAIVLEANAAPSQFISYGIGFYLWIASQFLVMIGSAYFFQINKSGDSVES